LQERLPGGSEGSSSGAAPRASLFGRGAAGGAATHRGGSSGLGVAGSAATVLEDDNDRWVFV
jgi:hypothetical protein